jgi:hypothetical protein
MLLSRPGYAGIETKTKGNEMQLKINTAKIAAAIAPLALTAAIMAPTAGAATGHAAGGPDSNSPGVLSGNFAGHGQGAGIQCNGAVLNPMCLPSGPGQPH